MRRALLLTVAMFVATAAGLVSLARPKPGDTERGTPEGMPRFIVSTEEKNPWTMLTPNAAADKIQFAVVSDRTGGHRAGVFSRAVKQINLLQPEFVMSVGDLIEGSVTDADSNTREWEEFDGYVKQFQMPFFYCPGNHDTAGKARDAVYRERYGRPHYHFLYKDALFIVLNSNDPAGVDEKGETKFGGNRIGKPQQQWLEGVLKDNPNPRWTFIFLHHPIWNNRDLTETGWMEVEQFLAGRNYSVFCGHVHVFRVYHRNGTKYYQLATTGGGSSMRGTEYGEFDQCAWVTLGKDAPVISNVLLNGVLTDDLSPIESAETGSRPANQANFAPVTGKVMLDGKPLPAGFQILFTEIVPKLDPEDAKKKGKQTPYVGNSRLNEDGSFEIFAQRGVRGVRPGRYAVTIVPAPSIVVDPSRPAAENPVPEKYRSVSQTPFRVTITKDETNEFSFQLASD